MQHAPQLLPLPKGEKKRETRISNFNKDCEIELWCIMCSKRSYLVFKTSTLFFCCLSRSRVVNPWLCKSMTFFHSRAFACFINKKLVWEHNLALVEKATPMAVEMIDGCNFFLGHVMHEKKTLTIIIGLYNSKIVFNVISYLTNPIIIGLSWLILHNLRVD
jgi:hypothetical protein